MATMLIETLLINSDEPFVAAFTIALPSKRVEVSFKRLEFFLKKYTRGATPPTSWLIAVAIAAPASLYSCGRSMTKTASKTMFVTPEDIVTASPKWGNRSDYDMIINTTGWQIKELAAATAHFCTERFERTVQDK